MEAIDNAAVPASSTKADSAPSLTNRSVLRAISLLRAAGNHPDGATASTLADESQLPQATAFRILLTLEEAGLLVRDRGLYSLGWETYRLGRIAEPHRDIHSRVKVVLDRLSERLQENVAYSLVTGPTSIEFTTETHGPHLLSLTRGYMGKTYPLYMTAAGKILLAHLSNSEIVDLYPQELEARTAHTITDRDQLIQEVERVRSDGYAIIEDELEVGLYAVAVAVVDTNGDPIGTLVVAGRTERMKPRGSTHFAKVLQPAAQYLGASLCGESQAGETLEDLFPKS